MKDNLKHLELLHCTSVPYIILYSIYNSIKIKIKILFCISSVTLAHLMFRTFSLLQKYFQIKFLLT